MWSTSKSGNDLNDSHHWRDRRHNWNGHNQWDGRCDYKGIRGEVWRCTHVCKIEDKDFEANFDGEKWTVKWKGEPPMLQNRVKFYKNSLESEKNSEFEEEVERWIADGILVPWKGEGKGVLPLMAVFQTTKKKVRPVLDYCELNHFVACHTGSDIMDVCDEKMRKWRWLEGGTAIVDLKSAYLQLHVAKELWQYQLVSYK